MPGKGNGGAFWKEVEVGSKPQVGNSDLHLLLVLSGLFDISFISLFLYQSIHSENTLSDIV